MHAGFERPRRVAIVEELRAKCCNQMPQWRIADARLIDVRGRHKVPRAGDVRFREWPARKSGKAEQ